MVKDFKYNSPNVKIKEDEDSSSEEEGHVELPEGTYKFIGANTLPDRVGSVLPDGTVLKGEILSKHFLDKIAGFINDTSKVGGDVGSYRTISLFHDRVKQNNPDLEEAGFIQPNAEVVPMENHPGNFQLNVIAETNAMYNPSAENADYTPEKINYKIEKKILGLSIEYNNTPDQEQIVDVGEDKYLYVMDTDDFRGFGYARANRIGNTSAVRIKEITEVIKNTNSKGGKMDEKEIEALQAKLKEADNAKAELEKKLEEEKKKKKKDGEDSDDSKAKEIEKQLEVMEAKTKEIKLAQSEFATKIKEDLSLAFSAFTPVAPAATPDKKIDAKLKEINDAVAKRDWTAYMHATEGKIKEQAESLAKTMSKTGPGLDFEECQTLKVKCQGRTMIVVPGAKTKDVIDSSDMATTIVQTNAMFADRYVPGITETFLKSESLLTAMLKEQHIGGNDKYQWRIWLDFTTVTGDNTLAVDPDVTAVARTQRDFKKLETRIVEYRDAVEVTDFTQHHSRAAIGDLMGVELTRAAEAVTNSMNADLFKGKTDNTAAWLGFIGLLGVADSNTHGTIYGETRTAANRLLDATLTNTFDSTAEAITVSIVREGYEKVLAQGTTLSDIVIVAHPTQVRRLFDAQDNNVSGVANTSSIIRHQAVTMAPAPEFGFKRDIMPHIDGIPIIRDYYCTDAAGNADTIAAVDMGSEGFVLVVSKPLGARGLAKVGTSEAAYVNFWGCAVYKRPRNVWLHDDLTV